MKHRDFLSPVDLSTPRRKARTTTAMVPSTKEPYYSRSHRDALRKDTEHDLSSRPPPLANGTQVYGILTPLAIWHQSPFFQGAQHSSICNPLIPQRRYQEQSSITMNQVSCPCEVKLELSSVMKVLSGFDGADSME